MKDIYDLALYGAQQQARAVGDVFDLIEFNRMFDEAVHQSKLPTETAPLRWLADEMLDAERGLPFDHDHDLATVSAWTLEVADRIDSTGSNE